MSKELETRSNKQYFQVYAGAFRTKVREDYPGAIKRENKNNVVVYEREVPGLSGMVENVEIEDSEFGKQIKITLDENAEGKNPVLSFGVESKNGRDVLRKLPGVDFSKEVEISPYRFTPEDKEISGISIMQGETKIENFFFDKEKKEYLHNFPVIDWDTATESQQKIYKIQRDEFLVNYLQENVCPQFADKAFVKKNEVKPIPKSKEEEDSYPTEDLGGKVPF